MMKKINYLIYRAKKKKQKKKMKFFLKKNRNNVQRIKIFSYFCTIYFCVNKSEIRLFDICQR